MSMTLKEFQCYYTQQIKKIEFEKEIKERQTARICCVLANIHRDKKKKIKPFKEDDFMPKNRDKKMDINSMANILKVITIAHGGEINNVKPR